MIQRIFTAVFLFLLFFPTQGFSAPTGDIGNAFLWKKGLFTNGDDKGYTLSLEYYMQNNEFLRQRDRAEMYTPNTYPPEERHMEISRLSQNEFIFSGLQTGITFGNSTHAYVNIGLVNSKIDLDFLDETTRNEYGGVYSIKEEFSSDSDLYYGIGVSTILHDAKFRASSIKTGLDLRYKRFSMEDDRLATQGRAYECSLEEWQLSFNVSALFKELTFYGGVKVSAIAGDEKYTDMDADKYYYNKVNYDHSIERQTYIGAFFGVTIPVKEWCAVTLETHIVDEEGYSLSCMTKF